MARREEVVAAVSRARAHAGAVLLDFRVEKEEAVFPMVPAGADLHRMIRRPVAELVVAAGNGNGAAGAHSALVDPALVDPALPAGATAASPAGAADPAVAS